MTDRTKDPLSICQKWMSYAISSGKKEELRALWIIYDILMQDSAIAMKQENVEKAKTFITSLDPKTDAATFERNLLKTALEECGIIF